MKNSIMIFMVGIALLSMTVLAGCDDDDDLDLELFIITSSAFNEGASIPVQYTCDGTNISPPLQFIISHEDLPNIQSLVLIVDDPDAPEGTFVHWVLYDLPGTTTGLAEGISPGGTLPEGSQEGNNDFGTTGYGGPCPPSGSSHQYYFRLYGLDTMLSLPAGSNRAQVDQAMNGHIVQQDELMAVYAR